MSRKYRVPIYPLPYTRTASSTNISYQGGIFITINESTLTYLTQSLYMHVVSLLLLYIPWVLYLILKGKVIHKNEIFPPRYYSMCSENRWIPTEQAESLQNRYPGTLHSPLISSGHIAKMCIKKNKE